jgi:hypothetical protein
MTIPAINSLEWWVNAESDWNKQNFKEYRQDAKNNVYHLNNQSLKLEDQNFLVIVLTRNFLQLSPFLLKRGKI